MKELRKHLTTPVGRRRAAGWAEETCGQEVGALVGLAERTQGEAVDCVRQGWLNGKLRLRASGKVGQRLPWQEKLPVSHERVCWKVGLQPSR